MMMQYKPYDVCSMCCNAAWGVYIYVTIYFRRNISSILNCMFYRRIIHNV
jgi:hypothetical protein